MASIQNDKTLSDIEWHILQSALFIVFDSKLQSDQKILRSLRKDKELKEIYSKIGGFLS